MYDIKTIVTENRNRFKVPSIFDDEPEITSNKRLENVSNIISVVIVLIGFGLIAWYGYKLHSKPVNSAELPVVKSDNNQVKVKPSDPGGMVVLNMDKTIYDNVSNKQNVHNTEEKIIPGPEEPVDRQALLSKMQNNIEQEEAAKQQEEKLTEVAQLNNADVNKQDSITNTMNEPSAVPAAVELTPSNTAATNVKTIDLAESKSQQDHVAEAYQVVKLKRKHKAIKISDNRANKDNVSKYKVQLASFRSQKEAKQEWEKIRSKNKMLAKYKPLIEKKELSKGTFYRLQIGLPKEQEARGLCKTLTNANQSCFVVK
jgi:hypothetical protein